MSGASIHGGYTRSWGRGPTRAIINHEAGESIGARTEPLTAPTTLDFLEIIGGHAVAPGEHSIGLLVSSANSNLTLNNMRIVSGNAESGAPGAPGQSGVSGGPGQNGQPGACDSNISAPGGSGGSSVAGRNGGVGGAGRYSTSSGNSGGTGAGGTPGGSGGSGGNGGHGSPGQNGAPGSNGAHGTGGASLHGPGEDGAFGTHGNGGGGGGGGGGQNCFLCISGTGNGGGGGGAGGQRGTPGNGGDAGGSSMALYLMGGNTTITNSELVAGDGGDGGAGGAGGQGGNGGDRGLGRITCDDQVGRGGNGGVGGRGGNGGYGGGGSGGYAIGIRLHDASADITSSTFALGVPGAGGAAPNAGAAGQAHDTLSSPNSANLPALAAPLATYALIITQVDTISEAVTPLVADGAFAHTFTILGQPASGVAEVVNNQLVYTPAPGYTGLDSFPFRAERAGGGVDGYAIVVVEGPGCYANCDGSTIAPVLNVDDFTCFINAFAQAQTLPQGQQIAAYANCDGSTIAPVLNVDDFTCFINAFALGCP